MDNILETSNNKMKYSEWQITPFPTRYSTVSTCQELEDDFINKKFTDEKVDRYPDSKKYDAETSKLLWDKYRDSPDEFEGFSYEERRKRKQDKIKIQVNYTLSSNYDLMKFMTDWRDKYSGIRSHDVYNVNIRTYQKLFDYVYSEIVDYGNMEYASLQDKITNKVRLMK